MSQQQPTQNGQQRSVPNPPTPEATHEGILQDLTETDLKEGSKDILRNLVTKDFVLANFSEAEVNEVKWSIRTKQEMFFAIHPDQECEVTGDDRAAINDDPTDQLTPLTQEEKLVAQTFFDGVETRITRARDMKQQEIWNTQIAERRSEGAEEDGGGVLGRLRR